MEKELGQLIESAFENAYGDAVRLYEGNFIIHERVPICLKWSVDYHERIHIESVDDPGMVCVTRADRLDRLRISVDALIERITHMRNRGRNL